MKRVLLIAFFLEVGFALIVVPWSEYWDRNYFVQALPAAGPLLTNNFVRGAVSGLGLINVIVGVAELVSMLASRNTAAATSISPSHVVED